MEVELLYPQGCLKLASPTGSWWKSLQNADVNLAVIFLNWITVNTQQRILIALPHTYFKRLWLVSNTSEYPMPSPILQTTNPDADRVY